MRYGPVEASLDREQGANVWLTIGIREGKNREVRNVLEHLGLKVNRLIRVAFGPFELGELECGAVAEVPVERLRVALGELAKDIDLEGPVLARDAAPRRHSGALAQRASPESRSDTAPGSGFRVRRFAPPRNDNKKRRRDRASGPRPKYPKDKR
jgi:23S rRNA pseudouridine2605 synthase